LLDRSVRCPSCRVPTDRAYRHGFKPSMQPPLTARNSPRRATGKAPQTGHRHTTRHTAFRQTRASRDRRATPTIRRGVRPTSSSSRAYKTDPSAARRERLRRSRSVVRVTHRPPPSGRTGKETGVMALSR
jgi:hypothetical protein